MHEHQIANLAARLYAAHDTRWNYATCVREAIFLQEEAIEQTRVWREAHRSNPEKPRIQSVAEIKEAYSDAIVVMARSAGAV